jgi:cysteine desulfurase / selenocysteine lyase
MISATAPAALDVAALRRDEFPVAERYIYLNHAALGPMPRRTADTVAEVAAQFREQGVRAERTWLPAVERTRHLAACLLRVSPDDLAFTKNTTQALNLVAANVPWKPRDVVVTVRGEFPGNVYPWLALGRAGVDVRFVQPRQGRIMLADIAQALGGARMLAISWVQYSTGFRSDLAALSELCQRRNVLLCVDAMQGMGAFPLDLEATPVDFCAFGGHKWLMSPQGVGLLYVNPRVREKLSSLNMDWHGAAWRDYAAFDHDSPIMDGAPHHEETSRSLAAIAGLERSLQLLHDIGPTSIADHLLRLTDHLAQRMLRHGYQVVTPLVPEARSGILAVHHSQHSAHALWERLRTARIVAAVREGGIRLSPHVYNTLAEMDAVIEALEGSHV